MVATARIVLFPQYRNRRASRRERLFSPRPCVAARGRERRTGTAGPWPRLGLVLTVLGALGAGSAGAHTPHDPINHLALSDAFTSDRTMFVVVHNELKRSRDGGRSWHRLEQGISGLGQFSGLAVSRQFSTDRRLIAARTGDGLYASRDGGDTWRRLEILPRGLGPVIVAAADMPPGRPGGFAAVTPDGRLVVSEDAGTSWSDILAPPGPAEGLAMAGGARGALHLAVAGAAGTVLYSGDRGATWRRMSLARPPGADSSRDPDAGMPSVVMLAFEQTAATEARAGNGPVILGLTDEGRAFRWRPECFPQTGCRGSSLAWVGDAQAPVTAGLLLSHAGGPGELVAATRSGRLVAGSITDSWAPSILEELPFEGQAEKFGLPQVAGLAGDGRAALCAGSFSGLFCRTADRSGFREIQTIDPFEITGLALAPGTGGRSIAVATFNAGGWVSHDSGASWIRQPAGAVTDHFWAVAWPPASCGVTGPVFVGNQGATWYDETIGGWHLATPRSEAPGLADRLLRKLDEWTSGTPPARPRPKVFGIVASAGVAAGDCTFYLGTRYEGIWALDLTTGNWSGLGPSRRKTRAADLIRESGDQPLTASFVGRGVYEYRDGQWLPQSETLAESVTGRRPFGVFKGARVARHDGAQAVLLYGTAAGLFVRRGTAAWTGPVVVGDVPPGAPTDPLDAVAVLPDTAGPPVFLASVRGRGLFFSADALAGYRPGRVLSGGHMPGVRWIVPESAALTSGVVYAAGPGHLFRSEDRGKTWTRVTRPGAAGGGEGTAVDARRSLVPEPSVVRLSSRVPESSGASAR
jgi:photosystem II stability/assembly factor-like uncharacterized protein